MAMPGLTAEASLYRTTGQYYTVWSGGSAPGGVVPQQFDGDEGDFGGDEIPAIRGFPCSRCNSVCQCCINKPRLRRRCCPACAYCCRRCTERCGGANAVDVLEAVVSGGGVEAA